jgi:hypothetical protein
VASLTFSQSERRNLLPPILIALAVLGVAFLLYEHINPNIHPQITATHTNIYSFHAIIKGESLLVGRDQTEDDLYVLTTLHIDNPLKFPLFLKDFNASLLTADGQLLPSNAVQKDDLPNLYTSFPDLKKLATTPLYRDITIPPGQSAEGMVIFRFSADKDAWGHRKSANATVDFYHQPPQQVSLDANYHPLVPKP